MADLKTPLCDRLGIDHPIVLAPMAGVTDPALVAAVANAGGLADGPDAAVAATVSTWVFAGCLPLAGLGLIAALCFVRRPATGDKEGPACARS